MFSLTRLFAGSARPRTPYRPYGEEILAASVFAVLVLVLSVQSLMAHEFKVGAIEIDHPWSRATPGGATVGAGYFTLKNTGAAPDRLVSATSDVAERVEIHEMAVANGVMTMRPLSDGIAIPAGGSVAFKPGSYHIMFFGLKQPLKQGAVIDGTLTFEKAGSVAVKYNVDAIAAGGSGPDHSHPAK
ncbi:copper chaperone PCu(A)C [Xanthobacter autotrophicus]|uniref:copper chaperone PCu(A)C n=1 Tax=Xanthobacter autotrophicus TaxID=280 RepID=UPI0024A63871|nr:copper chaperone PCu(A)C [Xanthobacter autotrophicus]MDI4655282.1 copper chaperone PCu(A)C [Xanthobacter autotrophicus]